MQEPNSGKIKQALTCEPHLDEAKQAHSENMEVHPVADVCDRQTNTDEVAMKSTGSQTARQEDFQAGAFMSAEALPADPGIRTGSPPTKDWEDFERGLSPRCAGQ